MFNEFEKDDDQWRPDPSKAGRVFIIAKRVLKYTVYALMVLLIGFIVLRMFLSNPPSSMKKVIWNEKLYSEYSAAKAESRDFEILQIPTQSSFSEDGFYTVYEIAYCKQAKQLQFTVRSNDRALSYLEDSYKGISELEQAYSYSLTLNNADGAELVSDYSYVGTERFGYTYSRLIFENIDLGKYTSVKLNIACSQKPDKTLQTVNIYNSGVGNLGELPYFDWDAPKKVTDGIKKKEG